jgi:putative nucleotidyltransferase with HDIG domain
MMPRVESRAAGAPAAAVQRVAELVAALSMAGDLAMGRPTEHSLRTCVLAVRLGDALGLAEPELVDAYYVALLRFTGCTATARLGAAVFGDELVVGEQLATLELGRPAQALAFMLRHVGEGNPPLRRAGMVARALAAGPGVAEEAAIADCEVAQRVAARLGFGDGVQRALGQVFERWDGRGPRRIRGEALAPSVRVVHLAQDADTFRRLAGPEAAVAVARRRSGGAYDPAVVERFCAEAPRLLADLDGASAWAAALAAEPGARSWLAEAELDRAAGAIADVADLKSPHTVTHSRGVATLAEAAGRRLGLPGADVVLLRRAGLMHDIGRAGVSSRIWEKPAPLTEGEWERVRLHAYFTERVLARPQALTRVAAVAALHHERLDGSGYHRGLPAAMLPIQARVLAAADAYHAMTEPRPHRPARPPELAAEELRREARAGRLDGDAIGAVLAAAGHTGRVARREWPAGLTDREVEVLRLLARGMSKRQVAERLVISPATADHHARHIYDKIGVSTRAAATLFAMQHDLLGEPAAGE